MTQRLKFVPAAADELQIDLDRPMPWKPKSACQFMRRFALKLVAAGVKWKRITYTRSRHGNTHASVVLYRPISDRHRIKLQLALGSDPSREARNAERVRARSPYPIGFFEVEK